MEAAENNLHFHLCISSCHSLGLALTLYSCLQICMYAHLITQFVKYWMCIINVLHVHVKEKGDITEPYGTLVGHGVTPILTPDPIHPLEPSPSPDPTLTVHITYMHQNLSTRSPSSKNTLAMLLYYKKLKLFCLFAISGRDFMKVL